MKIIILATDSSTTWMMVNTLRTKYSNLQVVLERPVSRLKLLKRRMSRVGVWVVVGQVFFILYLPILRLLSRNRIRKLIFSAGLSDKKPSDFMVKQIDSVNSKEFIDWLSSKNPDIVVLNGTRILSQETLNSCEAIFLNTHCGITPAYRGVHGGYWALYNGDIKNVGVTVHQVDPGIDTGAIVYQDLITTDENDTFLTYPIKQYIQGIPLMLRALADVEMGNLKSTHRDDLSSAIWQHPTLCQYLSAWWQKGVR